MQIQGCGGIVTCNLICVDDGGQPVGHNDSRPALAQSLQGQLDETLAFVVQGRRGFIT